MASITTWIYNFFYPLYSVFLSRLAQLLAHGSGEWPSTYGLAVHLTDMTRVFFSGLLLVLPLVVLYKFINFIADRR